MKLSKLTERLKIELLQGSLDTEITSVEYDSRKAAPGGLFVAMTGFNSDGHDFVPMAIEKGAAALVVEKEVQAPESVTVIKVEDSRRALALISAAFFDYPAEKLTVIGLTGTKGKTTTAHMIKAVLEASGEKVGMIGTLGAVICGEKVPTKNTTPESYELHSLFSKMVEAGCRYAVMEASSQGFKMHRTDGIEFDYGLFLNISNDHIGDGEHKNFDEYLYCKSLLFRQSKVGIVNRDDNCWHIVTNSADCEVYTFALDNEADFKCAGVRELRREGFLGSRFTVESDKISGEFDLNMPGRFNVYNAMATVSVAALLGIPAEAIEKGLSTVSVKGRTQVLPTPGHYTILIDYAHNAISMESLMLMLKKYEPGRLICLFGGGGNRAKSRRLDMGEISGRYADLTILTMDNPRFESVESINRDIKLGLMKYNGKYIEIEDRAEAIRYAIDNAQDGDIIALIGKGHEEYQEIEGVKHHFSEAEVVEEYLNEKH
jgi:UDP-N-acetylmuramoyl-L-alanyl-D-glutamate--2,6-diaminopimelate ligase